MRISLCEFVLRYTLRGFAQYVGYVQEILAKSLNTIELGVVYLLGQSDSKVFAVGKRSLVLVVEFGVALFHFGELSVEQLYLGLELLFVLRKLNCLTAVGLLLFRCCSMVTPLLNRRDVGLGRSSINKNQTSVMTAVENQTFIALRTFIRFMNV